MKKSFWILLIALTLGALVLSACGGGGGGGATQRQDPPAEYASMTNPFEGQADAVAAGKDLFITNCASCHGDSAKGDGPAAAALDPAPANLQDTTSQTTPAYEHWVITKGGAAAGLTRADLLELLA